MMKTPRGTVRLELQCDGNKVDSTKLQKTSREQAEIHARQLHKSYIYKEYLSKTGLSFHKAVIIQQMTYRIKPCQVLKVKLPEIIKETDCT